MSVDVLITGGGGMLARAIAAECDARNLSYTARTKAELDVTNAEDVLLLVKRIRPRAIIQGAAFTRVDDAETIPQVAHRVNGLGAENVARAAIEVGARFVYPSTDYVFDGSASEPIPPDAAPHPLNVYGSSKLAGEHAARLAGDWIVVRMSWLYGGGGRNFVRTILQRMQQHDQVRVVSDQFGRPTWTRDAAAAALTLITNAPAGIYHLANDGIATWFDVAREVAALSGAKTSITACSSDEFAAPAARPRYSVLDCSASAAFTTLPGPWQGALARAMRAEDY